MKGWLFLVIAIVGEVIATSALKSSEGFTKLAPSAVVIIGYGIAFYFLSLEEFVHYVKGEITKVVGK
ncbi:Ethidium bromide-methyl viologen resistance protein EmrE [Enterobacter roggenkampii]|nr:Ethidium bromide-methyl viologen resistance protein EmrE [Enterobacter roggenkampii]